MTNKGKIVLHDNDPDYSQEQELKELRSIVENLKRENAELRASQFPSQGLRETLEWLRKNYSLILNSEEYMNKGIEKIDKALMESAPDGSQGKEMPLDDAQNLYKDLYKGKI